METIEKIVELSLLNAIKEEDIKYNDLAAKITFYNQKESLEEKCNFWHENKIPLDSSSQSFFQEIDTAELPCFPNSDNEIHYYQEWLLRKECKDWEGESFDIILPENEKNTQSNKRRIIITSFEKLLENLKIRLKDNNFKVIIENELKLQKQDLQDVLRRPYLYNFDNSLFEKLMANQPLHELLFKFNRPEKYDALRKFAIIWDKAKYVLFLEKAIYNIKNVLPVNDISLNPISKQVKSKLPNSRQKSFCINFLKFLNEGITTTQAVNMASKKSKYSERNGMIIYEKIKNGELIFKELSEKLKK
ncbi:hypothetical protein [Emticicia sp. C21]|uniref:hypothetical protein n=1 Tax=Emticicia sp. C21 TaxID=2302915 RepID=UPI000E34CDCD|nr:hypothetical protein [Emticicia sp. C21]RFS17362.1 hypothetical protein D0T08_06170 [Emticicia sp. C21]